MERKHHGLKSNRTRVYRMEQKKKTLMTERSFIRQISRLGTCCMMSGCAHTWGLQHVRLQVSSSSGVADLYLCSEFMSWSSDVVQFLNVSNAESHRRVLAVETPFHVPSGRPRAGALNSEGKNSSGGGRRPSIERTQRERASSHLFFSLENAGEPSHLFKKKKTDLSIKESRLSRQHLYEAGLAWFVTQWGRRVWRGSWWLFVKILWSSSVSNSHTKKYPTGWCFSTTHIPFSTSRSTCVATFSKRLLLGRT